MSSQYLRKAVLSVSDGKTILDLSNLQYKFETKNADVNVPNTLVATVLNMDPATANKIGTEYNTVSLSAGYQDGPFGLIFTGTIKQVRKGRINPTDTYVEILGADADLAYNFGIAKVTLAKNSTLSQRIQAVNDAMGVKTGYLPPGIDSLGGVLPRGKVLFGMGRDLHDDLANSAGGTWSIQNGQYQFIPLTGYLPGDAIVLTSRTGMIGLPEQTDQGIKVRSLLNPAIKIGSRVQINNTSIQNAQIDLAYTAINLLAFVAADGFYRVYVAEHTGDTRDNDWYTDMICLSIDASAKPTSAVNAYG